MTSERPATRVRIWRGVAMIVVLAVAVAGFVTWTCWSRIAVALAPAKSAVRSRSAAALAADDLFWRTFHSAKYEGIQSTLEVLTAAYLQTPGDAVTASHIAWLHFWRVAERKRLPNAPATITDDVLLARRYFEESVNLNPHDPRTQGFLASALMSEGQVQGDERLVRHGYFAMQDAIRAWPAFNLFTAGYVLSDLPTDSDQFQEGLEDQWKDLDACAGERIDRLHPDLSKYMGKIKDQRACLNTRIAPHNIEGFLLNMGDMLVKSGNWQLAQEIYGDARLSPQYGAWPFAAVLEDRIRNAELNVAEFVRGKNPSTPVMVDSAFSCMACHED